MIRILQAELTYLGKTIGALFLLLVVVSAGFTWGSSRAIEWSSNYVKNSGELDKEFQANVASLESAAGRLDSPAKFASSICTALFFWLPALVGGLLVTRDLSERRTTMLAGLPISPATIAGARALRIVVPQLVILALAYAAIRLLYVPYTPQPGLKLFYEFSEGLIFPAVLLAISSISTRVAAKWGLLFCAYLVTLIAVPSLAVINASESLLARRLHDLMMIWRDSAPPAEMVAGLALRVGLVGLLCAVAIGIFSKRRVLLDRA